MRRHDNSPMRWLVAVTLLAAACGAAPTHPSVLDPQSVQSLPPGLSVMSLTG